MPVRDYYENYELPVVGTKIGIIGAYLLIVFLNLSIVFNVWVGLVYLIIFFGVIYGYFAKHACPSCFYYGKRCTTATGLVAVRIYPKKEKGTFEDGYQKGIIGAAIVYLLPLVLGIIGLFFALFVQLMFLVMMLFLLFLLFVVHRKQACRKCYNRDYCPAGPGAGNIYLD